MMYHPASNLQLSSKIYKTKIDGLYYISHGKFSDARGFFSQIAELPDLEVILGNEFKIKQINQARSENFVTRGFHCENWNKFITVTQGSCFCAIADVKSNSSTYKTVETFMLGDGVSDLAGSLFITKGLGNSLCVVNGPVDYIYCVDALYRDRDKAGDTAISLFDPSLNVAWPIPKDKMIISDRDLSAVNLPA